MTLLTHGLAAGLGYLLGRPDGRARLARTSRKAADLAQRPDVVRVRERGQDLVKNQARAVKQKVVARPDAAAPASSADDARPGTAPTPRGLRSRMRRPRFSRSGTAHFPSSAEAARAAAVGETAAEAPTSPTHRP